MNPHLPRYAKLIEFETGRMRAQEAIVLAAHLKICASCRRAARRFKQVFQADSSENDSVSYFIEHLVERNEISTSPERRDHVQLDLVLEGCDRPGRIHDVAKLFADRDANICQLRYALMQPENRFGRFSLMARDGAAKLLPIQQGYARKRLAYRKVSTIILPQPMVPVFKPWEIQFRLGLADSPGLAAEVCALVGLPHFEPAEISPGCETVNQPFGGATIVELDAQTVNDAEFPEGGVPGFIINARIALTSRLGVEALGQRLERYHASKAAAWMRLIKSESFQSVAPSLVRKRFFLEDRGQVPEPIHFFPMAHCADN